MGRYAIGELAHWSAVLQRAEIRLSDYRETLTSVFDQRRQAFFFVDSPYRKARKGAASAAERYYGKSFDVDELGRQCQRISFSDQPDAKVFKCFILGLAAKVDLI
ncbi:hypothetical protein A6A05_16455 [Magnetospirillum moscoviense]|uniref:Uncharacterized protein n=2 Tax=Magnetospirillum moscoviense TaxID=1437059 RepID=A0A178MD64_9PROT|nr:hypothetical protein A6A05_16455 [Magnetospirillum moscoviense]